MGDASNIQTDFRGGEWSPAAQGRMDDKEYPRSLNVCFNAYPTEPGAWTRRQGTRWVAYTRNGLYAWLQTFAFAANAPYVMEFTDQALRFLSKGAFLVMTNDPESVVAKDTSNPVTITTENAHGWSTGDTVQFLFSDGADVSTCGILLNRQFVITVVTTTTFTLADVVTNNPVDGSTFTLPQNVSIGRILVITSPYTQAQLPGIRTVQAEVLSANVLEGNVVCLHSSVAPQTVINTSPDSTSAFAQFTMSPITFKDGPYFDPPNTGTITPSALTGTVTLSSAPANTFVSTDVGRLIRLFSEPAAWLVGTAYSIGNVVKYTDGAYYTAIASSTGKAPNTSPVQWAVNTAGAVWAWGVIASYVSATSVTVAIDASQALLYTTPITTWRLGVYSATTGYPTCGVFHEGRLWLAGAQGNRFDASNSNDPFNFAPTAVDGSVGDANAISYVFNSDDVNPIYWMATDHSGIIAGTLGGEWVISASNTNDPLTPTSIQAHRVSKYRCANIPPVHGGMGLIFVKAFAKRVIEYVADVFSGRFLGRHLSEKVQHLTGSGFEQIVYQQDLAPNVWARMGDGSLIGMLYKRESSFTSEPPVFAGWHRHQLGNSVVLESIAVGSNNDGTLETTYMSVLDPATGYRHVEFLTDMFPETGTLPVAWFVDGGMPATVAVEADDHSSVSFYGFMPYVGKTISMWVGGLDLGDYVVAVDGSVSVPLGSSSTTYPGLAFFTDAFLSTWENANTTAWDVSVLRKTTTVPAALSTQSFIDTSVVAGTNQWDIAYDPANNRIIESSSGNATTDGFKVFSISTGLQIAAATNIFPAGTIANDRFVGNPLVVADNFVYWYSSSSNSGLLRRLDLATMKLTASFGVGSSTATTNNNHLQEPTQMVPLHVAGTTFLVSTALSGGSVSVMNLNRMQWAGFYQTITENVGQLCAGFTQNSNKFSSATAFVVGSHNSGSTANLGVYTLTIGGASGAFDVPPGVPYTGAQNSGIVLTRTGGITVASIDPTWTNVYNVYGPVFDQTDGNIIIWAHTVDAVTHTDYVIKINPFTAAIVWKTAVTNSPSVTFSFNRTNIQYGTLAWLSSGTHYLCTTSTGAVVTSTISGFGSTAAQFSDDASGRIYCYGSLAGGAGSPAPINATPATFTNDWCYLQSFNPPSIVEQIDNLPVLPAVGGFTYTSQGQRLRPVSDSGARNGPGFAKLRRNQKAGFQLSQAQGISIGTQFVDLTKVRVLTLKSDNVNVNTVIQLFTGVIQQDVDDPNSLNGMLAWQITRPYPCTVTAVGGFLHTTDI